MATTEPTGIAALYERDVLPALVQRLDQAFPEFAWQRDPRGWHATNQEFTHTTLGVRADRVICHGDAPRGFLVHGQGPVLWTTYVNRGHPARGREFMESVRNLAERAGVDFKLLDRPPTAAEHKAKLLHDAFELCQRELESNRGEPARDYLFGRGISRDRVAEIGLGVMPERERLRDELLSGGHSNTEIAASGLLGDTRWPRRVVGAWRDERSQIVTLWARTIERDGADRYLYLRGAPRAGTIPYGLSDVLANPASGDRKSLLLLEGVMDVHILRAHGIGPVAALGGAAASRDLFDRFVEFGIEHITFALDRDPAGREGTARSIDHVVRAPRSPSVWVIDPDLLDPAKDPGELVGARGPDAWRRASAAPICGVTWRALDLAGPMVPHESECARRAGLARAGAWLGHLPARLTIEQTSALETVADCLGYDTDAVRRAFRARYWRREPGRDELQGKGITR